MKIFTQIEYLNQFAHSLSLFKKIGNNSFNFRCPICGDSKKDKRKARGYLFTSPKKDSLVYKCHNCGISLSFSSLLQEINPELYRKYRFDIGFRNREEQEQEPVINKPPTDSKVHEFLLSLPTMDRLPSGHVGVEYLKKRKIPSVEYHHLRYIDDTARLNDIFPEKDGKIRSNKGIVFPFMDWKTGVIGGCSTRILDGNGKFRYLTLKHKEFSDSLMVFHRGIDRTKPVYVVEGQFDSLFIKNSIAACNSSLFVLDNADFVYVFDNEPHNPEIDKLLRKTVDKGFKVVIWERNILVKDVNEMILLGIDVNWQLENRVFSGTKAKIILSGYRHDN